MSGYTAEWQWRATSEMDRFLHRRASDARFLNERRVSALCGAWYTTSAATSATNFTSVATHHTFSASSGGYEASPKMSDSKSDDSPRKSGRKLKRKKGSDEFTEAQKKKLRDRESSDNSDSATGCWSGYESVEGVAKGKKGSCKKKSE